MAVTGELEQAVMDILWSRPSRRSVREVHELLSTDRDLAYTTVMTVLDRLAKKGLLLRNLEGRAWLYAPARSRVEEATAEVLELLQRLTAAERSQLLARLSAVTPA